jgi:hypothetical protein
MKEDARIVDWKDMVELHKLLERACKIKTKLRL